MKKINNFNKLTTHYKLFGLALIAFLLLIGLLIGTKYQENKSNKDYSDIKKESKEVYLECIADKCPTYTQIDAIPTNNSPETAIVIPLAMTQGYGKLVIIGEGGNKLFDSGELPNVGLETLADGNGFILKYSSPMDENLNRKDYETKYIWKDGKFVETKK